MKNVANKRRVLSVFSLVMINVIAVDSLRSLPTSAEYGFSLVFFYLLGAFLFMIPSALVTAELATGWPKTGGVYVWVREAFGLKTSFINIWLQWIYNVVWYPTILSFIAAAIAYLINPHLADDKPYVLTTVLVMFWGATLLNCLGMQISSIISSIGALIGTLIPMVFIIILGIIWVISGKPLSISFSVHSFIPDLSSMGNLAFLTSVIFGLIGMEMSAVHAEEVKNPQRDYPRALLYSSWIVIISLILASLAIAIVVPSKQISLVTGLIQAFAIFFNDYHMGWMLPIIVIFIIIGGIGGVATWVIGPTKGLLVAAEDGCLPPALYYVNKKGAPVTILILQAIIFTLLCSIFLLFPTINSSFWILSNLTSELALIFYVLLFAAAIRLRYKHPATDRSYKIPGGKIGIWLTAGIGILTSVVTIILGFFPPSQINVGNVVTYEVILIGGIVLFCVAPLIIFHFKKPSWGKNS